MDKSVFNGWEYPCVKADPPNERFLKMIASPEVNGYGTATVLFSHIPPGSSTGVHTHPSDEIMHFVGRGQILIGGKATEIQTDSVVIAPKGVEHECRNTSRTETLKLFCVYVPPLPAQQGLLANLARETKRYLEGQSR